jgi:hypothetical protein
VNRVGSFLGKTGYARLVQMLKILQNNILLAVSIHLWRRFWHGWKALPRNSSIEMSFRNLVTWAWIFSTNSQCFLSAFYLEPDWWCSSDWNAGLLASCLTSKTSSCRGRLFWRILTICTNWLNKSNFPENSYYFHNTLCI